MKFRCLEEASPRHIVGDLEAPVLKTGYLSTDRALAQRRSLPSSAAPGIVMIIAERDSIENDTRNTIHGKPIVG